MPPLFSFFIGVSCLAIVILIYLLYRFIEIFREFVSVLREYLKDE